MAFWNNPYLILLVTTLIWGGNAIASRAAPGHISPMLLSGGRWAIALVIVLPLFARTIMAERQSLHHYWKALLFYGITGFLVFNVFAYMAGKYTTAINIGIIQGLIPLLVLVGAYLAFHIKVTKLQMIGTGISMMGLLVLAGQGTWVQLAAMRFNFGDVLMVLACLGYAIYTVALRKRPPLSTMAFFVGCAIGGFLGALPLIWLEWVLGALIWPDGRGWIILLYAAILPSIISQILFARGVELIGPGRAGLSVNLLPVWTSILGPLLLGEKFEPYHGAALALVLGGIAVAEWGKPQSA